MDDLMVKNVNVFGDSIMAAKDKDGYVWAGVSYFCKALGMDKAQKDNQVERVQKDDVLKRGAGKFPAGVFDDNNEAVALRIDYVPIWLTKISITPKMKKIHPELADKLLNLQLQAKDILADTFLPQNNQKRIEMSTDEKIQLLAQGHTELKEEIDSVKQELENFKQDMPLLAVECDRITTMVQKCGVDVLGGKDSNAYKDVSLRSKIYQDIYRELKRQFGVSTYKAIKRSQCNLAISIVKEYEPPMVLQNQIRDCNAQINMEVA